jgi:hypothetical protein
MPPPPPRVAPIPVEALTAAEMHEGQVAWIRDHQPANTKRAYGSSWNSWLTWCKVKGLPSFPAPPAQVSRYMQYLHEERGLKASTINSGHVSAIADMYKFSATPSPTRDQLVLASKRVIATMPNAVPVVHRKPIDPRDLTKVVEYAKGVLSGPGVTDTLLVRDVFMLVLMVAAFLRPSEAVAIRREHVAVSSEVLDDGRPVTVLTLFIPRSKTDQEGNGASVVLGKAATDACPLAWYDRWAAVCNREHRYLLHDPRGEKDTSKPLSSATPKFRIRALLARAGVADPDSYCGHSPRPTGATAASRSGIATRVLKRHGRWKSDAVYVYVHDNLEEKLAVSAAALPASSRFALAPAAPNSPAPAPAAVPPPAAPAPPPAPRPAGILM